MKNILDILICHFSNDQKQMMSIVKLRYQNFLSNAVTHIKTEIARLFTINEGCSKSKKRRKQFYKRPAADDQ